MCIERLPPSSFMGSTGNFTAADVQVDPDIDTDFDDYDIDSYDPEYAITDQSSEWTDYLWMENEQEFEQEEIRRLEEEELANQCLEAMGELVLLDEIRQVEAEQHNVKEIFLSDIAQKSNLNPFAEEFFPADVVVTYI